MKYQEYNVVIVLCEMVYRFNIWEINAFKVLPGNYQFWEEWSEIKNEENFQAGVCWSRRVIVFVIIQWKVLCIYCWSNIIWSYQVSAWRVLGSGIIYVKSHYALQIKPNMATSFTLIKCFVSSVVNWLEWQWDCWYVYIVCQSRN